MRRIQLRTLSQWFLLRSHDYFTPTPFHSQIFLSFPTKAVISWNKKNAVSGIVLLSLGAQDCKTIWVFVGSKKNRMQMAALVCWSHSFLGENIKDKIKYPVHNVCQFLCYKYSHHSLFPGIYHWKLAHNNVLIPCSSFLEVVAPRSRSCGRSASSLHSNPHGSKPSTIVLNLFFSLIFWKEVCWTDK